MAKDFPCLIFSEDCILCEEIDVLTNVRQVYNLKELEHAFFSFLGRDVRALQDFCKSHQNNAANDFIIIKLYHPLGDYLYAFCEKNTMLGSTYVTVYLAKDQSEFYRLLSPSSEYFRTVTGRLIYEILYVKNRNLFDPISLSPQAFLTLSRTPNLVENLVERNCYKRFCNLGDIVWCAVSKISEFGHLSSSNITVSSNWEENETPPSVELPVEIFTSIFCLQCSIAAAASLDHNIDITVSYFGDAAEVGISTKSAIMKEDIDSRDIFVLWDLLDPLGSYAKITSIIAHIANLNATISYDKATGTFSIFTEIGYDKLPVPDFKYSDATESIISITNELRTLFDAIN